MPRHLPLALDTVARWPRLEHAVFADGVEEVEGRVAYPEGGEAAVEYLRTLAVWQQLGFTLDEIDRADVRALWKHRPDLREVLGAAIQHHVCEEFARPFLRQALAGGGGDVARWVAAFPDLRAPLREHHREQTRRHNQPFAVVRACTVLTRELGEPPEVWRAAALAIQNHDRRQSRLPPERRNHRLRHDLETSGTLGRAEAEQIDRLLVEIGEHGLDLTRSEAWWQPPRPPGAEALTRMARASHALAGPRWREQDTRVYARALAALPAEQAGSFAAHQPFLRAIVEASRELVGSAEAGPPP